MKKSTFNLILFFSLLPSLCISQQSLELTSCEVMEYPVNDHTDSDGDGDVCETMIVLSNSAFYMDDEICQLSGIQWTVIVDLDADGTDDLEFSTSLPFNDSTLDDTNNNGIPDLYIPATLNNEIQNIQLPDIEGAMSNHSVTWTVFDDCNLSDICNSSFTIVDKKAPTPYCASGFSVIYEGIDIEFHAADFNVGSFDNCTDIENVRVSFSGDSIVPTRILTCEDALNSPITVSIYFWDDFDNVDYCNTTLLIIPGGTTDCFGVGEISGIVKGWRGDPIEGVEVKLDAEGPDFPQTAITDAQGRYTFGIMENNMDYTLSASFDNVYLYGVSTLDLVLIVRHLLGIKPFLNPYQIIAADINGDNVIKATDLILLRKLILGVVTELPTNTPWKFIRSDFEFINPLNPFPALENSNEDPYSFEFNDISSEGYDFIVVKIGDVNN